MGLFSAFTPLAGGSLDTYRYENEYAKIYDLNGALDYVRPKTGVDIFPFPSTVGYLNGLVPQFNLMALDGMTAAPAFGPWTGQGVPMNTDFIFPNYQGLSKVTK